MLSPREDRRGISVIVRQYFRVAARLRTCVYRSVEATYGMTLPHVLLVHLPGKGHERGLVGGRSAARP